LKKLSLFPKSNALKKNWKRFDPSFSCLNEDVKPAVFVESLRKNIGDYDQYVKCILSTLK